MDEKRYSCEHVVPIEQEPRHHLVIEHFFVRAFAVEIAPFDRTLCHCHSHDYLVYVVGNGEILSVPRDGEWKRLSYSDGECESSPAGLVHVVENLTDTTFRNIVIELLPILVLLRRREGPTSMTGKAVVFERFSNDRTAVFTLEMEAGSAVEVCGPAVVASPYGHPVRLEEFGKITRTLSDFRELAEVWPRHQVLVRNTGKTSAQVVVCTEIVRENSSRYHRTDPAKMQTRVGIVWNLPLITDFERRIMVAAKFFFTRESPVFMLLSSIPRKIFHQSCTSGVV